jgi:type VI secretion system protein
MGGDLLRRITSPERSSVGRAGDLMESIAAHLRVLLNSRQGEAAISPTYGVADFASLVHSPQSPQALAASIRATILEFEPRLKNVAVRQVEDGQPLVLRFEITAAIAAKGSREVLKFKTEVSPAGHVELT